MLAPSLLRRPAAVVRRLDAARRLLCAYYGPRQQSIEQRLTHEFAPSHLEVINESHGQKTDESHFKVIIVSDVFAKMRLLARHRAVSSALLDASGKLPFHSLSVAAAKTPAEWGAGAAVAESPRCAGGDGRGTKR